MSLVSIIVPCYNYGWVLHETLDSLLAQTHTDWECIVIDDGSMDNTRQVAEQYQRQDNRFRYVHQPNAGLSSARNHGLELAKGKYIQLLDADDLLMPDKLAIQALYLEEHPEVDITYGSVRYFYHGAPTQLSRSFDMQDAEWQVGLQGNSASVLESLTEGNRMVVNAPLIRAALFERVGFFSTDLRSMEDWEVWLRCALAKAYFHFEDNPATWALVRVHKTSMSQNKVRMLEFQEKVRMRLEKLLQQPETRKASAINNQQLQVVRQQIAIHYLADGQTLRGMKIFWKLARTSARYLYYAKGALYWLTRSKGTAGEDLHKPSTTAPNAM